MARKTADLEICSYVDHDWDQVWAILCPVMREGRTYAIDADVSAEQMYTTWIEHPVAT